MTGETTESDQPLMGRKRTKKKSLIGIDPLAWMNEETIEKGKVSVATEEVTETDQEIKTEIIDEVEDDLLLKEAVEESNEEVAVNTDSEVIDQETKEEEVTDMEMKKENSGFKLEGPIGIVDVAELYLQFKSYLAEGNDLEIDCSEVEGVDTATLQLLTAFINEAEKQDKTLIWKDPSDSLQATVKMMGLIDELKM